MTYSLSPWKIKKYKFMGSQKLCVFAKDKVQPVAFLNVKHDNYECDAELIRSAPEMREMLNLIHVISTNGLEIKEADLKFRLARIADMTKFTK